MLATRQSVAVVASFAIIIGIAAAIGYGVGIGVGAGPRMSETKVFRDVLAQVGDKQITALVGDVAYGVSGEVAWVDASGSSNTSGWPACAPAMSLTRLTFGGALVYLPSGSGFYRILWVDCRK